jgi:hypothetical protein
MRPSFNPDPPLHVTPWVVPDLVVAPDPVPLLAMTRNPDSFSAFWDPLPVDLPVTPRFVNHRSVMIDICPVNNGRLVIDMFLINPLRRDYR